MKAHLQDGRGHGHEGLRADRRALIVALGITTGIMVVEAVGGFISNSLALLSDAGHMLTDVMALSLSLIALQFTARPASSIRTYGFYRMEILAALVNGSSLVLICALILYEAYKRFLALETVKGEVMMGVALIGLVANGIGVWALGPRSGRSLNLKGAYLHIVGDALSSLGVIAGGIVISVTGWVIVDPIISLAICGIIIKGAVRLVKESVHILLESVPRDLDLEEIQEGLMGIPGVKELHDVHLWTIASGIHAMSAHVLVDDMLVSRSGEILQEINRLLRSKYRIEHTTIQLECENCQGGFYCDLQTGCVGVTPVEKSQGEGSGNRRD